MRVTAREKEFVEGILNLANTGQYSYRQHSVITNEPIKGAPPLSWIAGPDQIHDYQKLRQEARGWLADIASGDEVKRSHVAKTVADIIGATPDLIRTFFMASERRFHSGYSMKKIKPVLALAAAVILDRDLMLTDRLGQCGAPGCGCFNLTLKGKPRRHCNEEHRLVADEKNAAKRMRDYRERLAEKKQIKEAKHGKKRW
jgi:hypothetical protein